MACMKLGSKSDAFRRQGQTWFCTTGLPSDIVVEVGDMSFHLHKFPLLSRSGVMEQLISQRVKNKEEISVIKLSGIPGGAKAFELVAKFCYGIKLEITPSNVICLRCASEHLQMTEAYGEGNLVHQTEVFLNQVVLRSWKDSIKALQACEDLLPCAEELNMVKRCIESLVVKACTDPHLFGRPMTGHGASQSPGGSVLWNGISTGVRPRNASSEWWFEDASSLGLPLFKRLITAMESHGIKHENISASLAHYAGRYLPGLNRRQSMTESNNRIASVVPIMLSEDEQRYLLEEIESLLPLEKGIASIKFLFGLLRIGMILLASEHCISRLEKRIGMQLDQATLEDLLLPNFSNSMETLYNVECVQHILEHFLAIDQACGGASPGLADDNQLIGSPSLTPLTMVAKLIDGYLAEIASDSNLKLPKFQSLASAVPDYARALDDGLYRAVDIYLKEHPWLADSEREQLCRLMDCQKLSLEACTHAAQNERLPLRVIVQVLFFEQLQLRTSIAGCFLVSENLEGSRPLRSGIAGPSEGGWANAVRDNQVLRVGMDNMRMRVSELEKEYSNIKQQIEKLGRERSNNWPKKLGFRIKSQMCSAEDGSINKPENEKGEVDKGRVRRGKHKKSTSLDS